MCVNCESWWTCVFKGVRERERERESESERGKTVAVKIEVVCKKYMKNYLWERGRRAKKYELGIHIACICPYMRGCCMSKSIIVNVTIGCVIQSSLIVPIYTKLVYRKITQKVIIFVCLQNIYVRIFWMIHVYTVYSGWSSGVPIKCILEYFLFFGFQVFFK